MDKGEESAFLSFWRNLKPADKSTIRVFERPDLYSVYGDDAVYVANEVYRTKSVLKYIGADRSVAMCNLSYNVSAI